MVYSFVFYNTFNYNFEIILQKCDVSKFFLEKNIWVFLLQWWCIKTKYAWFSVAYLFLVNFEFFFLELDFYNKKKIKLPKKGLKRPRNGQKRPKNWKKKNKKIE